MTPSDFIRGHRLEAAAALENIQNNKLETREDATALELNVSQLEAQCANIRRQLRKFKAEVFALKASSLDPSSITLE